MEEHYMIQVQSIVDSGNFLIEYHCFILWKKKMALKQGWHWYDSLDIYVIVLGKPLSVHQVKYKYVFLPILDEHSMLTLEFWINWPKN
jgi:hypothetical protein